MDIPDFPHELISQNRIWDGNPYETPKVLQVLGQLRPEKGATLSDVQAIIECLIVMLRDIAEIELKEIDELTDDQRDYLNRIIWSLHGAEALVERCDLLTCPDCDSDD